MIACCGVYLLFTYSGWHQTTEFPERHKQWKYNISAISKHNNFSLSMQGRNMKRASSVGMSESMCLHMGTLVGSPTFVWGRLG